MRDWVARSLLSAIMYKVMTGTYQMTTNEMIAEIEETDVTPALLAEVGKLLDKSPYTTTFLAALAIHLGTIGDDKGQEMVLGFAKTMAKHEAELL